MKKALGIFALVMMGMSSMIQVGRAGDAASDDRCEGSGCHDGYPQALISRCIRAISNNGCNIQFGNRLLICKQVRSELAVRAVDQAFNRSCTVTDATLNNLVRIQTPQALGCAAAIIRNGCNIDYGNRALLCLRTRAHEAVRVIDSAFNRSCTISDSTLANLIEVKDEFQSGCIGAVIHNGCNIDFGNRALICLRFCTHTAVDLADDHFRRTCTVTDSTLQSLASIGN